MSGQGSPGPCAICGQKIEAYASFVDIGPTDWNNQTKPRSMKWIPVDEDIHGWTPFETVHPACFASEHGIARLIQLVDDSHRLMRRILDERGRT